MGKISKKGVLNPMSEREMRLVKGGEMVDGGPVTEVSDVVNDDGGYPLLV